MIDLELLPCPICNGLATIDVQQLPIHDTKENIEYFAKCTECGLRTMGIKAGKKDRYGQKRKFKITPILAMQEVAALWNKRTDIDNEEQEV